MWLEQLLPAAHLPLMVGGVIVLALLVYALTAGADFGGGIWDLLARGPRAQRQRRLVARAIAPIWEANHVWLILVVVLLFVCLPRAFAAISIALHVPLTLMLVGIVLRGAAFVFRSYDVHDDLSDAAQSWRQWSRVFAVARLLTPLTLGMVLGAVVSGALVLGPDGQVVTDFVSAWWAPFPVMVGLTVTAMFAALAAVYLAVEAEVQGQKVLADDFRWRALAATVVLTGLALGTLWLARTGAPPLWHALTAPGAIPVQVGAAALGLSLMASLVWRRLRLARMAVVGLVTVLVLGWGTAQMPHALPPDLTLEAAAAPTSVLRAVLVALVAGSLLLLPAFVWLYRVFKSSRGLRGLGH